MPMVQRAVACLLLSAGGVDLAANSTLPSLALDGRRLEARPRGPSPPAGVEVTRHGGKPGRALNVARAQSFALNQVAYLTTDVIVATYDYSARYGDNDWVGIYHASTTPDGDPPSLAWEYVNPTNRLSFDAGGLGPGDFAAWYLDYDGDPDGYHAVSSRAFTVAAAAPSPGLPGCLALDRTAYLTTDVMTVTYACDSPADSDWVGIYHQHDTPGSEGVASTMWDYISDAHSTDKMGAISCAGGSCTADVCGLGVGTWKAMYLRHEYVVEATVVFTVARGGADDCACAALAPSTNTHAVPAAGAGISRVAFGSCFQPDTITTDALWRHVRGFAQHWVWLGDNAYSDTAGDMEVKRRHYSRARDSAHYATVGPIGEPKIPVTGTWDDHDFGYNNIGGIYECKVGSQNEFAIHFNIPPSDPRHPSQGEGQQRGIYAANMFSVPSAPLENGLHLIHLDARFHRSPTFIEHGACQGSASTMLGAEQWAWLEAELGRPSAVKVIASGIQVLPPLHTGRSKGAYCSYAGSGAARDSDAAIERLGEGPGTGAEGTEYESWAEMPLERERLLRLAQRAINAGAAKAVVFISGDQHWAEVSAKRMSDDPDGPYSAGAAQTVYELTSSGIAQHWDQVIQNSNRLRPSGGPAETTYLAPDIGRIACSGSDHHVCKAVANYGQLEVDFERATVALRVATPLEAGAGAWAKPGIASEVLIRFGAGTTGPSSSTVMTTTDTATTTITATTTTAATTAAATATSATATTASTSTATATTTTTGDTTTTAGAGTATTTTAAGAALLCGDLRRLYVEHGCCGYPSRLLRLPGGRRLGARTPRVDVGALVDAIRSSLSQAAASGGDAEARRLAGRILAKMRELGV